MGVESQRRQRKSGVGSPPSPGDQGKRPEASAKPPSGAKGGGGTPGQGLPELPINWSFRGFMITYILLVLSFQRAHGYFIEQYLRGLGLLNVELSSLYRTLRQLESAGLVSSTWEHGAEGPARRVYSLTEAGRWWLDANAAVLDNYRTLIERFFGTYSRPEGTGKHTE